MADVIYCKDGSREVIFGDPSETLRRLILEKIGEDAERLFVRLMSGETEEWDALLASEQEKERAADGYLTMCRDAMKALEEALALMDAPGRLDRKRLYSTLQLAHEDLYKNL